jgi:hypothetical protein
MNRTSTKPRKTNPTECAGGAEGPSGRFWTQWIEPGKAAFLSQRLPRSIFVIKNHGPECGRLVAHDGDQLVLLPGTVRATYAYGAVTVENSSEKRILIEFEFLPISLM